MSKGQKFLKVTSILMIIGGALAGVSCLLGIAGVAMLASLADGHAAALMLYLALALALAAAVAEFIAGLKGLKTCKTGGDAHKCVVWGAVVAGITVVSSVMNVAGGGSVDAMSILLSLVVPGLYIYGAMQVQKGDWQPQQPKTAPPAQQPLLSGSPAAPAGSVCRGSSAADPAGAARCRSRLLPVLRRQKLRREVLPELRRTPALTISLTAPAGGKQIVM